jgi:ATP-dependent Clp endopeptidase proteolytic subunit ClpP
MIKAIYPEIVKDVNPAFLQNIEHYDEDETGITFRIRKNGDKGQPKVKVQDQYFKVVTGEREDRAEIFLYGMIGQDFWWGDEEMKEESITDISFIKTIRELEKDFDRIDIRINSPGGSVMHGDPIIAAIRSSKSEIHTYVDGMAASMAADIWVAGHVRHMGVNSKLMIHSTWSGAIGNAQDLRKAADMLDKFDETAIATFAAATGWTEIETKERFYDYEDHWLSAKDAAEIGLIERVEDYQSDNDDQEAEKQAYSDVLKAVLYAVENGNKSPEIEEKPQIIAEIDPTEAIEKQITEQLGENVDVSTDHPIDFEQTEFYKTDVETWLKRRKLQVTE